MALPPLHRARRQPRLHAADAGRDEGGQPRPLPRLVPAGVPRRAPDGDERPADVRAALRRPSRPRHPPARHPRGERDRVAHVDAARAGGEERRHLRLDVRRVLARRLEEHGVVEERDGRPDRGRLGRGSRRRSTSPPRSCAGEGRASSTYGTQINFPNPWRGGTWRLRDVMDYERIASDALLEYCATHREDVLSNMLAKARASIAAGGAGRGLPDPDGAARPGHGPLARRAPRRARRSTYAETRRATRGSRSPSPTAGSSARCWSRSASPR